MFESGNEFHESRPAIRDSQEDGQKVDVQHDAANDSPLLYRRTRARDTRASTALRTDLSVTDCFEWNI